MEKEQILSFNNGQLPPDSYLTYEAKTANADRKLSMIKEVMLMIASVDVHDWPKDEKWDKILPSWFLTKIKGHSQEEINRRSNELWEYGSWLDAMKFRGWRWHSSAITNHGFIIVIDPVSFPFSINPLEYLILETGIDSNELTYKDYSSDKSPK